MAEPLKNIYNHSFFQQLVKDFQVYKPGFEEKRFLQLIFDAQWENRALKDRMRHITHCLHQYLQFPYKDSIQLFGKVIQLGESDVLAKMFFPDFVEVYGLDDLETSLNALELFTEFASGEFAIRPFIIKYEEKVMSRMLQWSKNKNLHVRRLASEGCRPRLPWAIALPKYKKDPRPILPILENLKNDDSEYVRRSVANNINDISKDNPELVLKIAARWYGHNKQTNWVVKHACRSMLKQGYTQALLLFGFGDPEKIKVKNFVIDTPKVVIGEELHFHFSLENQAKKEEKLRIEYGIDYVKKSGKTSRKIFQITENTYPVGDTLFRRKQSFQNFTTRKHYPGQHGLAILVNGVEKAHLTFEVI